MIGWRCPRRTLLISSPLPPSLTPSSLPPVESPPLPHGALVHFRGRVRQVVVVSAAVERQWGKGGAGAEHLGGDAVQRRPPRDAGLRAGGLARVVRHDVGEALHLAGGVVARQRVVHAAQRGAGGARGRHEGQVHRRLRLRRGRALGEEVVVPSRAVVLALVIWGPTGRKEGDKEEEVRTMAEPASERAAAGRWIYMELICIGGRRTLVTERVTLKSKLQLGGENNVGTKLIKVGAVRSISASVPTETRPLFFFFFNFSRILLDFFFSLSFFSLFFIFCFSGKDKRPQHKWKSLWKLSVWYQISQMWTHFTLKKKQKRKKLPPEGNAAQPLPHI